MYVTLGILFLFSPLPKFSHHKELIKPLKNNQEMMMYLFNNNSNNCYRVKIINELGEETTLDLRMTENQKILVPLLKKDETM